MSIMTENLVFTGMVINGHVHFAMVKPFVSFELHLVKHVDVGDYWPYSQLLHFCAVKFHFKCVKV